ncbi:nucleoid-associated protein [Riemerella anatipestifer]|uniref:nucleoid-associated protein n=1 Tax=Riemerella anatipestifer TaxID=34085 RepID=UPI000699AB4F|nr:nucleoid-associated protein [Riemerella anatipestifer]MDY3316049.1 nucleoid-associated protein [Riemerella anatipestifer]MDY3318136.1 nucleoid-associated protein [Riemerella anatipestifer]MDY3324399.1 nucleoid-associated protein [Riemerella anatipestifer]MDY3344477.1 nucleoid-associated protein [Riemerella anatipestifer]MDY3353214.1 nucleoid-associated protein [Riemerella anatipestifer]
MFSKIIVHKVGNKINQENLFLSSQCLELEDDMKEQLEEFFLKAFKSEEQFQFYSDTYLSNNPVYSSISEIFEDPAKFQWESENIAKHLYEITENPRVQSGELFIVYFEGEETDAGKIDSIGIFKTERKEPFLKINANEDDDYLIEKDYGIGLSKLDKGAIIYNNNKELGYVVSVVDNNKNGDLYYWFEDFLKVRQREDDYFHTQETLSVYKDYITKQLPQEFEVTKADQADFLNKSINFFKEKEQFDFEEFSQEVLQDENIVESFINFKTDYEQDTQMSISEAFAINPTAVKKQQRHFKSVIKLDKNFHIYVHGDRKMIETGQDEKGKFYRLYFEEEQ